MPYPCPGRAALGALLALMLCLSACGGGGGEDGGSGGGGGVTPPPEDPCLTRLCLSPNLGAVATLAVTSSARAAAPAAPAASAGWWQRWSGKWSPAAQATSPPTINILAYDAEGRAVPNPLVANVSLYIAGVTTSPDGQDVYLFLDDNQNSTLYPDYRALRQRCVLYRVRKASGAVECLMDADRHAISNPGRNPVEYGNRAEPFIKFDAQGNGFMMAYQGGGSVNHRLYKLPRDGAPAIVRDFVDEYYGQNIAQARDGRLFYTEVDEFKSTYRSRAFMHDMASGSFSAVAGLTDVAVERIATSIDGQVYLQVLGGLHRVDQDRLTLETVSLAAGSAGEVIELTRNPAGGVFVLLDSGEVHVIEGLGTRRLAQVGAVPLLPHRDADTDLFFQRLVAGDDVLAVRGSVLAPGADTREPAICLVEIRSGRQRCEPVGQAGVAWLSSAFIGPRLHAFYALDGRFMEATTSVQGFLDGTDGLSLSPSSAGNGSIVASVSLRPAVSFSADLSVVRVNAGEGPDTVRVPVEDSYSVLRFTSPTDLPPLEPTTLVLLDPQGQAVPARWRVSTRDVFAVVIDPTGTRPSGLSLFETNAHSLVLPAGVTPPVFERSLLTRSGHFPVPFTVSTVWLDLSAPAVNLDLSQVRVSDAQGQDLDAIVELVDEGLRIQVRFRDTDPASRSGLRRLPAGTDVRVRWPDRVRLPGQTFLSPFERNEVLLRIAA